MEEAGIVPEIGNGPRKHHYVAAHVILKTYALDQGRALAGFALSGRIDGFLRQEVWERPGERLSPAERVPPGGLGSSLVVSATGEMLVIVTFPTPEGMTEAYFGAVFVPDSLTAPTRYFTLEHTVDPLTGRAGTKLCEWTDDAHLNFGDGPGPEAELFIGALTEIVEGEGWAPHHPTPEQKAEVRRGGAALRKLLGIRDRR